MKGVISDGMGRACGAGQGAAEASPGEAWDQAMKSGNRESDSLTGKSSEGGVARLEQLGWSRRKVTIEASLTKLTHFRVSVELISLTF